VVCYASLGHLAEIGLWALVFVICGEFRDYGTAFYHSAVNYTSLGYGDLLMSASWRLLGPLETANGSLLFGISTAMIFAVMLWLIQVRFTDLKGLTSTESSPGVCNSDGNARFRSNNEIGTGEARSQSSL
jgi:Ion channel